jgi:hypothetical protein
MPHAAVDAKSADLGQMADLKGKTDGRAGDPIVTLRDIDAFLGHSSVDRESATHLKRQ